VRSYRSELVNGRWFGRELSVFEWHYIPEWHSECNTISIGNPVRQPLSKAIVQTSINNVNVFKSFQLMLAPPSTLLSNAMDFARTNARSFKDVLASACVIIAAILKRTAFRRHYESMARDQVRQKGRPCLKKDNINQIAVLTYIGYTYSKTCITKQKYILKLVRNIDKMQFQFLEVIYFLVTTLSYICFLLNTLKVFRATVKSLQYSLHPTWS